MLLVDSEDATRIADVVAAILAELPKPKRERRLHEAEWPMALDPI